MPRIPTCVLCAALASLALAACASGSRPGDERPRRPLAQGLQPGGLLLASFDSNGDYRIDPAEQEAGIARAFAVADRDGDGAVSLIELGGFRALAFGDRDALPGPFTFDANQDGSVTAAEFTAALKTTIADYANADGAIPFSALVVDARAERARRAGANGDVELIDRRQREFPY